MDIRRLGEDDVDALVDAGQLFDEVPSPDRARGFLGSKGNHCLVAYVDEEPAGFVTGVEIAHPDKETEMLLYELGVDERRRGMGIGRALVAALEAVARDRGLRGMWVLTEPGNAPALATYRSAGADAADDAVVLEWRFAGE
jgi:ribosomal protein S18 acetylase RimI-like enzyme